MTENQEVHSKTKLSIPIVLEELTSRAREIYSEAEVLTGKPAKREYLLSDSSKWPYSDFRQAASDVKFTQGEKSTKLKNHLPGEYWIYYSALSNKDIAQDRKPNAQARGKFIYLEDSSQPKYTDMTNIVLLHDAAHFVDDEQNAGLYHQFTRKIFIAKTKKSLAGNRLNHLQFSNEDNPAKFSLDRNTQEVRQFNDEEIQAMEQDLQTFVDSLIKIDSLDQLEETEAKYLSDSLDLVRQLKLKQEYGAWLRTLEALSKIKKDGINLFRGSFEEFIDMVSEALSSLSLIGVE